MLSPGSLHFSPQKDKFFKTAESLFMSRKLKHRRIHEPEKPDYVFTVRGKIQPPEKRERWEKRMDASEVVFSPCSVPETPCDVSYKTPECSGPVLNPASSPDLMLIDVMPTHSTILSTPSPFSATLNVVTGIQPERGSLPPSPFPAPSFVATPRLQAATTFQDSSSAPSPVASTPGLVADTNFEGASPGPWNDDVHRAICAVAGPSSDKGGPPDTGFIYMKKEAEDLEREVLALERIHGKDSAEALKKMRKLFNVLLVQGRYKSAEIVGRRRLLAHRDRGELNGVSEALVALAGLFSSQGDLPRAEKAATKAHDISRTPGGGGDYIAVHALSQLAFIYTVRGEYQKAEEIQLRLLDYIDNTLNGDDDCRAEVTHDLANTLFLQGRLTEAEDWAVRAVELQTRDATDEAAICSYVHMTLVKIRCRQAKYKEAREVSIESIAACKKIFGMEHPRTAAWMSLLGFISIFQGQWKKAETCLRASVGVRRKLLGPTHYRIIWNLVDMLFLYVEWQLWDQAEDILAECRSTFPRRRPDISLELLSIYEAAIADARMQYIQAIEIGRGPAQRLESTEPLEGLYANNVIVRILRNLGRLEESEDLASRTIDLSTSIYGTNHPETQRSRDNLARTQMVRGAGPQAIQLMKECVQSFTACVGAEHYLTVRSQETLTEWEQVEVETQGHFVSMETPSALNTYWTP
ncbi:hypothetical protein B0T16DRAFT_415009 [Cercophora newfieldiana]|uniref:Uncharacterized protein n=1 Tax=Cercophora newfieldiana TaxID=92897 RepID=A0AA39XZ82_9PEZI|nr:hypothetical protein B0T16DRAFT_415009 [Cercophora newfieldiana]